MANPIVILNTSVLTAPIPITLQSTGALISQGGTNLAAGTYQLLVQSPLPSNILAAPLALAALNWSGGTVVATTSAPIVGRNTGDVFTTTIAGALPAGYNGTYRVTVTGTSTFTYALAVNPGSETLLGTYTPPNQGELNAMVGTFFSQGSGQAVYVLELGPGDQSTGPAALSAWIAANPQFFYAYLVPRGWDGSAGLLALQALYQTPTSKTYFFVTTSVANYTDYTGAMKGVLTLVEAPGTPLTEFSLAADFQHILSYAPSSTNRMTQNCYAGLSGVTPYPQMGNGAILTQLIAANSNYVGTGAEGGVTNTILFRGRNQDGNDFAFWYSADWIQLNTDQALSNYVIEQSQNKINPLYYSQIGINRLQDVAVGTFGQAISYGLAAGTVVQTSLDQQTFANNLDNGVYAGQNVVNAVPFTTWVAANPSTYAQGVYGGFTGVYLPQNGFTQIVFNLLVTNLISQF
jgi:hypothetical protein